MIEQIFGMLDEVSKLSVSTALSQPALRDFFKIAAAEYDKSLAAIDPSQPAEVIADQYRNRKAASASYHDLSQFSQKLITNQMQQK